MQTIEEIRTTTTEDGLIIDIETGEIIGVSEPEPRGPAGAISDELVDWVLNKILTADSQAAAAEVAAARASCAREAMIQLTLAQLQENPQFVQHEAVIANAEAMAMEAKKKAEFFRARYSEELGQYASRRLGGAKTRTWKTPFGSIALRTVPAKLVVADEETFIEWATRECPTAVKRTPLISQVGDAFRDAMLSNPEHAQNIGLSIDPERLKVTIKSGVSA